MKTGIVDIGGGMRGIYAAGVFDRCMDEALHFDLCIGVSAGSANAASYLSGQRGRNYTFYTEYAFRREYMSLETYLRTGSYIDMDYVYGDLCRSDGEYPFDYAAFAANPGQILVVATDARTGKARYFDKSDFDQDQYAPMKASSAIPGVCRPYVIDGMPYFDGALGDTIPIRKAFAMGCDRVVLVLTKPKDVVRTPGKDTILARRIARQYPNAARRLRLRADWYNQGVEEAKELEARGKVLIVAPDDTCGVDTLTRDKAAMDLLYQKGYADAAAIRSFIQD